MLLRFTPLILDRNLTRRAQFKQLIHLSFLQENSEIMKSISFKSFMRCSFSSMLPRMKLTNGVLTQRRTFFVFDAKINIDDDALFRLLNQTGKASAHTASGLRPHSASRVLGRSRANSLKTYSIPRDSKKESKMQKMQQKIREKVFSRKGIPAVGIQQPWEVELRFKPGLVDPIYFKIKS